MIFPFSPSLPAPCLPCTQTLFLRSCCHPPALLCKSAWCQRRCTPDCTVQQHACQGCCSKNFMANERSLPTMLLLRAVGSILVVGPSTTPVEAALDRFERPQFCRASLPFSSRPLRTYHRYLSTGTNGPLASSYNLTGVANQFEMEVSTSASLEYNWEQKGKGLQAGRQGSARCGQAHSWGASGGGGVAGARTPAAPRSHPQTLSHEPRHRHRHPLQENECPLSWRFSIRKTCRVPAIWVFPARQQA